MGSNVFPAPSAGGGIKSVQRGSAGGAGDVTITAVDLSKSFVNVFGTASSGTVAASFNLAAAASGNTTTAGNLQGGLANTSGGINVVFFPTGASRLNTAQAGNANNNYLMDTWTYTSAVNAANYNVGGGSNNLVAAVVQGFLANSTTLTVSGACRWEVVEFA